MILRRLKKDMMKDALPKNIVEISETTEIMPDLQENHYQDIITQKIQEDLEVLRHYKI